MLSSLSIVEKFDMENITTPIDGDKFINLLTKARYSPVSELRFLKQGFSRGFTIGYEGPTRRQDTARNIPFTVGNKFILWEKIMKKVGEKKFAGPFSKIPYTNYIQSPIGLVPKSGGKTRLIFYLSYNFIDDKEKHGSLNYFTPKELCTVNYHDLDVAVRYCLKTSGQAGQGLRKPIYLAKSDLMSAFRMIPIAKEHWCWMVLKAEDPRTGRVMYFVDKCLPFGASISCSHFQRFSNAIKFLIEYITGKTLQVVNYLDDFLFIETSAATCNAMVRSFLDLCKNINLPVSLDKTEWACEKLVFLGILLDGKNLVFSIPVDKRDRAIRLLNYFTNKKKATVKQLQFLTGYLNFLTKAIFPGRAFTRRMYAKYSGAKALLKPYHHVRLDAEFKFDCEVWRIFLSKSVDSVVCRPMLDLSEAVTAQTRQFYSDASANPNLGYGAVFDNQWLFNQWEPGFVETFNPSIEYLELFALTAAVLTWGYQLKNRRIIVFCDNASVVSMVNSTSSTCKNCMHLIRLLVLSGLVDNRRVFARHVRGLDNKLADSLSRLDFSRFWREAPHSMSKLPDKTSPMVWPASKIWNKI